MVDPNGIVTVAPNGSIIKDPVICPGSEFGAGVVTVTGGDVIRPGVCVVVCVVEVVDSVPDKRLSLTCKEKGNHQLFDFINSRMYRHTGYANS